MATIAPGVRAALTYSIMTAISKLISAGVQLNYTVTPPRLATVAIPFDPKNPKSAVSFANNNV